MDEKQVRRATLDDARWIVDLSTRVQAALTSTGSLQQLDPLPEESIKESIAASSAYVLEAAEQPLGSVLVDPLASDSPLIEWGALHMLPGPLWYLHALMLEPEEQGKGLGLGFLEGVKSLVIPTSGTIILDCWAGNTKLRDFYQRAEFTLHGICPLEAYEVAVFHCSSAAKPTN